VQIGGAEVFVVSDGIMHIDGGGVFGLVPRVLWEQVESPDERNRVACPLNCLLVISEGKRILVDTGLGEKLTAKQEENYGRQGGARLLANLSRLGFQPEDIDLVVNTHLHTDHCGGNARRVAEETIATFPRAEYWIQKQEWVDASCPNERTRAAYLSENLKGLERVCLLEGDTPLTGEIKCIVTRGHTRGHQSILIESHGEKALYLGDLAGRAVYLEKLAWIPAYDVEPLETLETKRRVRDWAVEENVLLLFEHDPGMACGRIRKEVGRWLVERVEVD
jgi:glyoxylase-like metal-dependent hydrolase (beta-lactamase superfamily II)